MTRRPTLRHNRAIAITGEANNFLLSEIFEALLRPLSVIGDVLFDTARAARWGLEKAVMALGISGS